MNSPHLSLRADRLLAKVVAFAAAAAPVFLALYPTTQVQAAAPAPYDSTTIDDMNWKHEGIEFHQGEYMQIRVTAYDRNLHKLPCTPVIDKVEAAWPSKPIAQAFPSGMANGIINVIMGNDSGSGYITAHCAEYPAGKKMFQIGNDGEPLSSEQTEQNQQEIQDALNSLPSGVQATTVTENTGAPTPQQAPAPAPQPVPTGSGNASDSGASDLSDALLVGGAVGLGALAIAGAAGSKSTSCQNGYAMCAGKCCPSGSSCYCTGNNGCYSPDYTNIIYCPGANQGVSGCSAC